MYYSDPELLPFPLTTAGAYPISKGRLRCTPGCSMHRKSRGREHLGAMVLSTKCWPGAQRSWSTGHDLKPINRQIHDSLSHSDKVVLCATSLKTRSKSVSCTVNFTNNSLFFPPHSSLLLFYSSTITLLRLFSLGILPFTLSGFFLFSSVLFSFCFFCFSVGSQLVFLLFFTGFSD